MSITADIVKLRFDVQPQYDQQQMNELKKDLKDSEQILKLTYKDIEKNTTNYKQLNRELKNLKDNRDRLNAIKSRTKEEDEQLKRINKRIAECSQKIEENKERGRQLSQTYREQSVAVQQANKKLEDFFGEMDLGKMSLSDLIARQKDLNLLVRELKPGTTDFEKYTKALQETEDQITRTKEEIYGTKDALEKSKRAWSIASKAVVAFNAVLQIKDRIVNWADQYVQAFAKMDDSMTDVMKYTGQTKAEVEDMNETFKKMTTRTPREELNALAGAAGRLGIQGKKDIEGFVEAADKINVALGDDLGEGAIDQIGKLTMVFGEDKTKGLNGAMLATGSAINVLGANSSANTGFITEFTSSMAGMAVNAKISQTDIMGYASALSQAGIEGQTASGVFAQMITKMFTDPAKFAKAAGLEVKAFTDLLKTDANTAILQFLEGLKANGGFDAMAPALKSLKMQGTQAVPVISSLINKMDELKKAQSDARKAYDEGTSIIEEFNNANSSAAAKLEMAQKAMNDAAASLGMQLMPIVENCLNLTTNFIKVITPIAKLLIENSTAFIQLAIAIAAYNVAVNMAAIKTSLFNAKAAIAVNVTKAWNAVIAAGPYGIFAAAISLIATELLRYGMRAREATKIQEELNEAMTEAKKEIASERAEMDQLIGTVKSSTTSENERKEALEKLNGKLMSLHLGNLTEEKVRTGDLTTVLNAYNRKLETQIKLKRLQAKQEELINKKIDLEEGGYKNDISFMDRLAQGTAGVGQALISGHIQGFSTAFNAEWNRVEESFKNRALRPILEGLDTVEDKINQIRSDEEKAANTIDYIGEVVITGGNKGGSGGPGGSGGSGGSGGKTDKEKAERDRKRKELEAQEKAAYERELLLLRQQYQGRKDMQDEWHQKELTAEQRYLGKIGQLRDEYNADESEKMEIQNKLLDSIIKEANLQEERRMRNLQASLHNIDMYQAEAEMNLIRQQLDGEIRTQEEFNQKKLAAEIKYLKMRLEYLEKGSAEYIAAQKQLLSLELQQQQAQQKEKEQLTSSYQTTNNQLLHQHFSQADSWQAMFDLNEEYRNKDLISEQQYQQNLTTLQQQQADERTHIQQEAQQAVSDLLSSASQLFSAMQQRETSAVEKKYKKMIDAARKQGKDTTKLEEKMEAEKAAIQKKYADKQFKMNVLQIIASTATGIARLWKDLPFYAALPLTAVVAASGAMQLASAKAAADQAAGLYSGGFSDEYQEGYTSKGNPREQAGVIPVHRSEFVANHKAVANPQVRPLLDVIDRHQKLGDIQMLNATRMLEEAYGRGRYRGGYTSSVNDAISNSVETTNTQNSYAEMIHLLRNIETNTADAMTVKEVRDAIRRLERLEKNASR